MFLPVTQTFDDYSDVNQVSTEIKKTVDGNDFKLVFKTAPESRTVSDMYIHVELFCNCAHGWFNQLAGSEVMVI